MKSKLIVLTAILLLLLSACEFPPPTDPSTGSGQAPDLEPAQVETAPEVVEPEQDPASEEELEETESEPEAETTEPEEEGEVPALSEVEGCVELLEPLDGIDLPGNARVTFSWSEHPDADSYLLNFIFPDGLELFFAIDETTLNRYMDGFSMHPAYNQSGEHQWNVSALNAAGEALCQSEFFTFTKDLSDGVGEESSSGNNNHGEGDSDPCGGPGCTGPGGQD